MLKIQCVPFVDLYMVQITVCGYAAIHVILGMINPRRACAARVTVLGLCVCVCVCLLLNISLFMCLFVPQMILTFSAADEGRKF